MQRRYAVVLAVALLAPAVASAQGGIEVVCTGNGGAAALVNGFVPPSAHVSVNGASADLGQCISPVGDKPLYHLSARFFSQFGTGDVNAMMNPDPFITFGATTTNLVAGPVTYAFLFGTPIVPGMYSAATSTGGVTVTNGGGGTAVVGTSLIYPAFISGYGTAGLVATGLGVDLGAAACVSGPAPPFTATTVCPQGATASAFAPTFYDNLEALLTYTQSDVASVASWSGAVTIGITAVPEPASLLLVATGALLVGLGVRRGRS